MKKLFLVIGLLYSLVSFSQFLPTSARTRFTNGIALGTKLDASYSSLDSNVIYWRADSVVMAKYKGTARALAFLADIPSLAGYVTIATDQTITGEKTFTQVLFANAGVDGPYYSARNTLVSGSPVSIFNGWNAETALGVSITYEYDGTGYIMRLGTNDNNTGNPITALQINRDQTLTNTASIIPLNNGNADLGSASKRFGSIYGSGVDISGNILSNGTYISQTSSTSTRLLMQAANADSKSYFSGYGQDNSTNGIFSFRSLRADGSNSVEWLNYTNSTGTTITGPLTATGNISAAAGTFSANSAIGTTATGVSLNINKNITGSTSAGGVQVTGVIQNDVTAVTHYYSQLNTQAASFTLTNFFHYRTDASALGAGSAVTNQYGFSVGSALSSKATNNYGFYSNMTAGTGNWAYYNNGGATNYMGSGRTLVGSTTDDGSTIFQVNGTSKLSGNTTIVGNVSATNSFISTAAFIGSATTPFASEQLTIGTFTTPKILLSATGGYRWSERIDGADNFQWKLRHEAASVDFMEVARNGAVKFVPGSNGVELAAGATSWSAISDKRLKDSIRAMDSALSIMKDWEPYIGKYKTDSIGTERPFLNAQDVQKTYPFAVTTTADSAKTLRMSYTELIPLLVKGEQELNAKIEAQDKLIADMRKELEALKISVKK